MTAALRASAAILIAWLCASVLSRAQETPAQTTPAFRAGINFVTVDATVTDKRGNPITGLTAADFEVTEDGKPQAIEAFRFVHAERPIARAASTELRTRDDELVDSAREGVRVFAILLDDYHVQRRHSQRARDALIAFIRDEVRPDDLLTVMYPLDSVRTLTFTRDYEAVEQMIRSFDGQKCDEDLPPLACQTLPRNPVEEAQFRRVGCLPCVRRQIVTDALSALAVRLGSLRDGRKSLIYVSEGGLGSDLELRDVYRNANRNNVAIYPLDPSRYRAGASRRRQYRLMELADQTDGRAIIDVNQLGRGLVQMARDSSYYYLLGYSSGAPADGKFHTVKVKVRQPDVEVRARKGYWAWTEADVRRAATPAPKVNPIVGEALALLAASERPAAFVRSWIGMQRGDEGKTRITLIWEPLGAERRIGTVAISAMNATGRVVFSASTDAPRPVVFDASPGKLEVRLDVGQAGTGETVDREVRSIDVPDLAATALGISTPRVFRARTVREYQTLSSDATAIPTAARDFSRTERLLIRFDAYVNGNAPAEPTAALLNRAGQKMSDVPVTAAQAGGTHQINLPLASMSAGEYLVEIRVKSGAAEARELVPLRIGA